MMTFFSGKTIFPVYTVEMQGKLGHWGTRRSGHPAQLGAIALLLLLSLASTGCLSSLSKHGAALEAATAPVVDQAAAAYHAAITLHDRQVDYEAAAKFDDKQSVYNPRNIQPLISDKDLDVRLMVLAAFQCYTKTIVEITKGTDSPALDAASKSVGGALSSVGNALAPSIDSALGVAAAAAITTQTTVTTTAGTSVTATASTAAPAITPGIQNGISTAVNALGQFLVSRKIKKELPQKIKDMDPHLQALCELLEKELDLLQDQERRDYDYIINRQTLFIRESSNLNPEQRREEIMKLPEIVRQQRVADQQLARLRTAIVRLALTHHALAADAQGNNPESLKSKLGDLEAAGSELGRFYSSLSAKDSQ